MSYYKHKLELVIQAMERGDAEGAAYEMQTLIRMLGGSKQVGEMSAPAAMTYMLALYLARSDL